MLNLEIDYLTRQRRETEDKYKASLVKEAEEEFESQDQKLLRVAISTVENNIGDPLFGVEKMADGNEYESHESAPKIKIN